MCWPEASPLAHDLIAPLGQGAQRGQEGAPEIGERIHRFQGRFGSEDLPRYEAVLLQLLELGAQHGFCA